MPRACLPNARSLASAHSPLLPLLAPRAFAEAPFLRRHIRHDDTKPQEEREEKKDRGNALSCPASFSSPMGVRYADIFCLARQQMRRYSTERRGGARRVLGRVPIKKQMSGCVPKTQIEFTLRKRKGTTQARVSSVQRERPKGISRKRTADSLRSAHRWAPQTRSFTHNRPSQTEPGTLFDRRRERRWILYQRSQSRFASQEASHHAGPLTKHGKYRTLRRRIFNYSARTTQVDLTGRKSNIMRAFAALDRRIYPGLKRRTLPLKLKHNPLCASWVAQLFKNTPANDTEQVWRNWMEFDVTTREHHWPHLLLYLIHQLPGRALSFVQALTHQPCVSTLDAEIIADTFEHLARVYIAAKDREDSQTDWAWCKSNLVPTFHRVFSQHLAPHKRICSQDLLLSVAKLASVEDLQRVYDLLTESDAYIGYDVLLHYANIFAKAGEYRRALPCIIAIVEGARSPEERHKLVHERRFVWSCALILHRSMMHKENYHETTGIVATFVELGVKLDILLYNIVMYIAMEAGDYATAFKVYNSLEENGLEPDKYTFSTLLHGCTVNGEPTKFHDFAEHCAMAAKELRDPWLAADCLYYLYVRLYRDPTASPPNFEEITRAYLQFFSARPMEPFWQGQFWSAQELAAPSDGVLAESCFLEPPPIALYIMLQVEIQKAAAVSNEMVWDLYLKFQELVRDNNSAVLTDLATQPLIWNAFLLTFCRQKQFAYASQLIRDMTHDGPQPNIYSWNMFMQAFFKSQQLHAAERVYEIMRTRGIQPDQFTYEVLLRGYVRAQHVDKIGDVMQHVDDEERLSPKLLQELSRVHDRRRVMFELEEARVLRERRRAEKAAEREETERVRWAAKVFRPLVEPDGGGLGTKVWKDGRRLKALMGEEKVGVFKSALKK